MCCQGKPVRLNHQPIVDGKLTNGPPKQGCCDQIPIASVQPAPVKQTVVQREQRYVRQYRPARP